MEHSKIWGPPGTGKTRYLIDLCEKYLDSGLLPEEIIFCSFTRAAAHEARSRAIQKFGGSKADYPWFSTEHSICFRLLGLSKEQVFNRHKLVEFGRAFNYDFSSDNSSDTIESRYQEAMLQTVADYYEFLVNYMENKMLSLDAAYAEFIRSNALPDGFTRNGFEHYIERRQQYKQEMKLWSFSDMIVAALQNQLFPSEARVLILDEAQDCSRLLWELVKFWATRVEDYYIAGDPLQTLYFWSGSSPELFFNFPGKDLMLNKTYRFGSDIRDYALKVVTPTGLPVPDFQAANKAGNVGRQSFFSIDWHHAGNAFLLLRTRWLISQVVDYFISDGVPFVSERGRQSPLASTKGRAYYTLLRLSNGEKVSEVELQNLIKHTKIPYLERGSKARIKKLVEGMYQNWELKQLGFTEKFFDSLYTDFSDSLCMGIEDWELAYLNKVYRKNGRQVFERDSQLIVTTVHGSKGREKPDVYLCPDMTRTVWDSYARSKLPETLLYYVGATRAMDNLTILLPQKEYSFPMPRIGGKSV